MSCLTDLSQIEESLIRRLTQLDHATCLLRVLCDDDFLRSRSPSRVRRLWAAATCLFSGAMGVQIPPSLAISDGGDSKYDKNDWIERYLSVVGKLDSPEAAAIGFLWMGHARGVEHFLGHALPPEFVDAVRSGKDEIRNAWAIWFRPKSSDATTLYFETPAELERLRQTGGWCKYRHAGTRWDSVRDLLLRKDWHAIWPSARAAIKKVEKTCREFEHQRKTDFTPTVQRLEEVAVGIVAAQMKPWMPQEGQAIEEQNRLLLQQGLITPPSVLLLPRLKSAIRQRFYPCRIKEDQLVKVLEACVEARRFMLAELETFDRETGKSRPRTYCMLGKTYGVADRSSALLYQPTRDEIRVLQVLAHSPGPLIVREIDKATARFGERVSTRILHDRLPEMESAGLVERPRGLRSGYTITSKGSSFLSSRRSPGP